MRVFNKGVVFPKNNITGNMKTTRDKIITPISLLSFAIAKETTKSGSRLKFAVFMRLKKNETGRIKGV